jgi:hypothetical protein
MAIEDAYVVAACPQKYFEFPVFPFEKCEGIRRTRAASAVQKSRENKKQALSSALPEESQIAASVKSEWQQLRINERSIQI